MKINSINQNTSFKSKNIPLTIEQRMARNIRKAVRAKKMEQITSYGLILTGTIGGICSIFAKPGVVKQIGEWCLAAGAIFVEASNQFGKRGNKIIKEIMGN